MSKITFGKYAGSEYKDVPTNYLVHLLEMDTVSQLGTAIPSEIRLIIIDRLNLDVEFHMQAVNDTIDSINLAANLPRLKQIYRDLSRQYHPDTGGSNEGMQAINAFYQKLITKEE